MKYFKNTLHIFMAGMLLLPSATSAASASTAVDHQGWVAMSSGGSHRLAVKGDGTVWSWGSNRNGQLGNGEFGSSQKSPVQITGLKDVAIIGTGSFNSYAVLKDGTVWSWGDNTDGQVGDGTTTKRKTGSGAVEVENNRNRPVQLKELKDIVEIKGNFAASYALQADGTLWGWGFISVPYQTTPKKLNGWTQIKDFATGYAGDLIAVNRDGTVMISGRQGPEMISGLNQVKAVATAAGSYFALREDGTVWAWGDNHFGELGDGTKTNRDHPAPVSGMNDVVEIEATQSGPVYLKKDGTVWTNGSNIGGNLGIGSYEDSPVPVQVKGLTHIRHISAAGTGGNVMALRQDGTLWAWGDGYVGDGTEWWRTVPVLIKSSDSEPSEDVDTIKVDLNGSFVKFETFPILKDNTTLVPMRTVFELLGATVEWDAETATVTAVKGGDTIKIVIDAESAQLNGQSAPLDTPAMIRDGLTLVPVRFIAEAFGAVVNWDERTHTVKIDTPNLR